MTRRECPSCGSTSDAHSITCSASVHTEQSSHLHDDERIPRTIRTTPQGMLADALKQIQKICSDQGEEASQDIWRIANFAIHDYEIGLRADPSPSAGLGEVERLLTKIIDLAHDEDVGEPLDDAIGYANKALFALTALRLSASPAGNGGREALDAALAYLELLKPRYSSKEHYNAAERLDKALALTTAVAPDGARGETGVGLVVVPREPTEAMWGGLARAIVMWTRFDRPSEKSLLSHLRGSGETIPDWLAAECHDVDHVPPKGSVAVWIYRAMVDAALSQRSPGDT